MSYMPNVNAKKQIIFVAFVVAALLVGGGTYFYYSGIDLDESGVVASQDSTRTGEANSLSPAYVPEGWQVYQNQQVNDFIGGIAFAYPANWEVNSAYEPGTNKVSGLLLTGSGYKIKIGGSGTEVRHADWEHPEYIIDGKSARTWQTQYGEGYELNIATGDVLFRILTPTVDKSIVDQLLSSVVFSK